MRIIDSVYPTKAESIAFSSLPTTFDERYRLLLPHLERFFLSVGAFNRDPSIFSTIRSLRSRDWKILLTGSTTHSFQAGDVIMEEVRPLPFLFDSFFVFVAVDLATDKLMRLELVEKKKKKRGQHRSRSRTSCC